MAPTPISAADIWYAYFDLVVGHERAGRRPAVIVSGEVLRIIPSQLVFLVPVTSRNLGIRTHVSVDLLDGALDQESFAMTEQIRSMSVRRLRTRIGIVDSRTLAEIRRHVTRFMDIEYRS